jgi:hypothetical protein
VWEPRGPIVLRVGQRNASLERLLHRRHARMWAFVTAWNPRSHRLSLWRNAARQRRLERLCTDTVPGVGVGDDLAWPPEPSLLALGMAPGTAARLARMFGQNAILAGTRGRPARLVWCRPG